MLPSRARPGAFQPGLFRPSKHPARGSRSSPNRNPALRHDLMDHPRKVTERLERDQLRWNRNHPPATRPTSRRSQQHSPSLKILPQHHIHHQRMSPNRLSHDIRPTIRKRPMKHPRRQQPGSNSHPTPNPTQPSHHLTHTRRSGSHIPNPSRPKQRRSLPNSGQRPSIRRTRRGEHNCVAAAETCLPQPIPHRRHRVQPHRRRQDHISPRPDLRGNVHPNVIPGSQEHRHHNTRTIHNRPNVRLPDIGIRDRDGQIHRLLNSSGDLRTHRSPTRITRPVERQHQFHAGSIASRYPRFTTVHTICGDPRAVRNRPIAVSTACSSPPEGKAANRS
ncbi:hypothetical protein SAMN04488074_11668 [Lentzea albidocapillata subsp. violacea]|uniref:Uncharacterized protein n=1 Tax=Lentzea albidocapillata subsp. violacea TaxID=128104 RepID=A0A1G9QAI3_9PSEU|nr:hypothetical protein SAMN04488074_11668 [Lentzea albidocapillata subsp. violacea]